VRSLLPPEQSIFDVDNGVYVAYVDRDGAAASAGLPRNTVITHVNDMPVGSPDELAATLETAASPIVVTVKRRGGDQAFYEIL
jgi:putative serine protease PepD